MPKLSVSAVMKSHTPPCRSQRAAISPSTSTPPTSKATNTDMEVMVRL